MALTKIIKELISDNSVDASKLDVIGNGTVSQALLSVGDGTMSWGLVSGTVNQNGSASELKYWSGTQAQYDALTPNANTIYFIS